MEFLTVRVRAICYSAFAVVDDEDPLHIATWSVNVATIREESVVATMRIPAMEQEWALCALCLRDLPKGFHLV